MKNLIKFFAIAIVILGFSVSSFGQLTNYASATATATIKTAITISHTGTDMDFGNIVTDATGGTVILAPAGTASKTGALILTGTPTAAVFTVTGDGASTYAITLPSSTYTITDPISAKTMTVTTFTSTPSNTGILTSGTQELRVGATLTVGSTTSNPAGVYTNATGFEVTVAYN